VTAKIRSLFKDWASTQTPPTQSRKMDVQEEHWCDQFQLPKDTGDNTPPSIQARWELRKGTEDFANWKRERKSCILSFDRASKGNPGQAGGGGLIEKPNAEILLRYAIGLGIAFNNQAEAMVLWQGLCHAQSNGIWDLVIIGDSRLLIRAIVLSKTTQNAKLNNLLAKIRLLLKGLDSFQIFHVLRALNQSADLEANKGVELEAGHTLVNEHQSTVDLP